MDDAAERRQATDRVRDRMETERRQAEKDAAAGRDEPPAPSAGNGGAEASEQVERDIGDLLADVERERDDYLELARRTKADFENYRRRVAGEAAAAERRGRAALVRELVPVLDNLERALAAADPRDGSPDAHLAEGVRLVREELVGVLKRSGVESYEPLGEPFDPHLHEAMMTRPAPDADAGKVLEVLEKGYRLNDDVLRPARVVVGATGTDNEPIPPGGQAAGRA
jgi:molecular chaperone GrpE